MDKKLTKLKGVIILKNFNATDDRGSFTKLFNKENFEDLLNIKEVYYSTSKKGVIRGLHFQKPPFEHNKLVTVIKGSVEDIIVDLRKNSETYGKYITYELRADKNESIFIPIGCAHGFKSLEDDTIMMYMVSSVYNKENDSGIRWNSIDWDWKLENPIISEKDREFISLKDFNTPFE